MENEIASLMLKMSKFEFFLVNTDIRLARIEERKGQRLVTGVNWSTLARLLEARYPFAEFDFGDSPFEIFKTTNPQFLVKSDSGKLKWDSDSAIIDSWDLLLTRSYGQLRNNIAHGNKAHMPSPFTYDRTPAFISAGRGLIDFIAEQIFGNGNWEEPIAFR